MRTRDRAILVAWATWAWLLATPALADVKLPALFGSGMVLQRGVKVPIWGSADPGEQVAVTVAGQRASAQADAKGHWKAELRPLQAGGPFELTVQGRNTLTLANVLVGDVWVCSGQSNVAWTLKVSDRAEQEIAASDHPRIRLFTVQRSVAPEPLTECVGEWQPCGPVMSPLFSAVAYFFGRELHAKLGVPIGLIHTSWGGTPAEVWTARPDLHALPELAPLLGQWDAIAEGYPEAMKQYKEKLAKWREDVRDARAARKPSPSKPRAPRGPGSPQCPSGLFNGMVAPLTPLAIKGAIWYQGEANARRAHEYRTLFPALIRSWRKAWAQGDFPFLFVQLANFREVEAEPVASDWAELREAQAMALSLPNTAMAVIIDIGEAGNIHPRNKQDVGRRLALAALTVAYGQPAVHSGPVLDSMSLEGGEARIRFKHIGSGLVAKPFADPVTPNGPTLAGRFGVAITPKLRPKSDVLGFAIAGEDQKFVWAKARIEDDTVVVWSENVARPVAVRYAWENNPVCNLNNKEGLPAGPFRTDDWPGLTVRSK